MHVLLQSNCRRVARRQSIWISHDNRAFDLWYVTHPLTAETLCPSYSRTDVQPDVKHKPMSCRHRNLQLLGYGKFLLGDDGPVMATSRLGHHYGLFTLLLGTTNHNVISQVKRLCHIVVMQPEIWRIANRIHSVLLSSNVNLSKRPVTAAETHVRRRHCKKSDPQHNEPTALETFRNHIDLRMKPGNTVPSRDGKEQNRTNS